MIKIIWQLTIEFPDGTINKIYDRDLGWCLIYTKLLKQSVKRFKLATVKAV